MYVPDAQLDDARYVLLADEVDATLGAPSEWWDSGVVPTGSRRRWPWLMAALLLAVAILGPIAAMARTW